MFPVLYSRILKVNISYHSFIAISPCVQLYMHIDILCKGDIAHMILNIFVCIMKVIW